MDAPRPTLRGSVHPLVVSEIAANLRFFENQLGFERVSAGESSESEGRTSYWLRRDKVWFLLIDRADVDPIALTEAHAWAAYVWVDNVDALSTEFETAGGDPWRAAEDRPWGMRELVVRTPDGHRIVFAQPLNQG